MDWILSTLADVFVLDSQEGNTHRALELYDKWLKAKKNDVGFVPYIGDHFEEVARIIMGQLTHPFKNCKENKNDVPLHAEYCFVTIQLFYYLLESNISNDLVEWLIACVYGMFIPIYMFVTESSSHKSQIYEDYHNVLRRLINLMHYSILKRASVSNKLWEILCKRSSDWCTNNIVVNQWCSTILSIQDAYLSHIMSSKTGLVTVNFLKNSGVEVPIEIPEECLRTMWLSFIQMSNVKYNKISGETASLLVEGICLLMHNLSDYSTDPQYPIDRRLDGNDILKLYADASTLPIFALDDEEYEDAIRISVSNICTFFVETLPTTAYEPVFVSKLIVVIRAALQSESFNVKCSALAILPDLLPHSLAGLTELLELIYTTSIAILNWLNDLPPSSPLKTSTMYSLLIRTISSSLPHYVVRMKLDPETSLQPLLCSLLHTLYKTDLLNLDNHASLSSLITSFITSQMPTTPVQPITIPENPTSIPTTQHLLWHILYTSKILSQDALQATRFPLLRYIFTPFVSVLGNIDIIPASNNVTFIDAFSQTFTIFLKEIIPSATVIPITILAYLLRLFIAIIVQKKSVALYFAHDIFTIASNLSAANPSVVPHLVQPLDIFITKLSRESVPYSQQLSDIPKVALNKQRIFFRSGAIFQILDAEETSNNINADVIFRSTQGSYLTRTSVRYIPSLDKVVNIKEKSVKNPLKTFQEITTVPLFFNCCTESIAKPVSSMSEDVIFKSHITSEIPKQDTTTLLPHRGSKLYHSTCLVVAPDDVPLKISDKLLKDLQELDSMNICVDFGILIDSPESYNASSFFVSFVRGLGIYGERSGFKRDSPFEKFMYRKLLGTDLFFDCPKLFKTNKKDKYGIHVVWNCTKEYNPTLLSDNVIIITPACAGSFRVKSILNGMTFSDVYVSNMSFPQIFTSYILHVFVDSPDMFLKPALLRQKKINSIVDIHKFNDCGNPHFLFSKDT
ncbi:Rap-GAP domain-containing protein [Entamoeba marina]